MKLAKSSKKTKNSRSALRVEALESRQLLAGITGGGTEVLSNRFVESNGNTFDQVLMTGSSVTVTADAGQVTRVSFLDLQGDIVQAEFSGSGTLTISLDQFGAPAEAAKYIQPGVNYVTGLASFTIQGSDASTNFNVFTVGTKTAVNQALFDDTHTGGNNFADVARLTIVANPSNASGSTFGSIFAGNAHFSADAGPVGIAAANVHVQNVVRIGDINATGAGTPTLIFGKNSQFADVSLRGGSLVSDNGKSVNNVDSVAFGVVFADGTSSNDVTDPAATNQSQITFLGNNPFAAQTKTFTLSTGIDTVVGSTGDDKINGGAADITALDNIDGGAGNDTLTLTATAAVTVAANAKVANVENAVITSSVSVNGIDLSGWTGLTTATVASSPAANADAKAAQTLTVGGANLTLTNSASALVGGDTTALPPTNDTSGALTVNGGKVVTISNTFNAGAVNTDVKGGAIAVNGGSATTTVSVTQVASANKSATVAGRIDGAVTITDTSAASTSTSGKITDVTLTNFGAGSKVASNALANLTLAGTGGTLSIEDKLTTKAVTTLNLNVNALSASTANGSSTAITDTDNRVKVLNINAGGTGNSTLTNFTSTSVTALNVTGSRTLTLMSAAGLSALETVTVGGTAGLTATTGLTTGSIKSVNASGTSGAVTVAIDATKASFTGGSGVDTVTITAAPTKAIDGGAGTTDTLVINATAATFGNPSANANISNFERLQLGASASGNYNSTGFSALRVTNAVAGAVNFTSVAPGATLTLADSAGSLVTYTLGNGTGTADSLDLALTSSGAITNSVEAPDVETVSITNTDTDTTAHTNTLTLTGAGLKTLNVSGNASLSLTAAATSITTLNAGAATGGVTWTSAALASAATITSGSGDDSITATLATKAVTITSGAGDDTITVSNALSNTINSGTGDDTISVGNGSNTIDAGAGDDTITVGTGGNVINAGDGDDTIHVGASKATNTVDFGGGNDTLVLDGIQEASGFLTSISNANAGDQVDFSAVTTGVSADGKLGAKLATSPVVGFTGLLNAAASSATGGTNAVVKWFQFNGNTYVVVDNSNAVTFQEGLDTVVELKGEIDLSNSTLTTDILKIV